MTKSQSVLEKTRADAQELHKKISDNIAKAGHATWTDVKSAQADVIALGTRMKALADDQADNVKSGITAAVAKLEAAGKLVENKATDAKGDVKHANEAMRDSAHKAAQSLSAAVAAARTKLAEAIKPKKGAA